MKKRIFANFMLIVFVLGLLLSGCGSSAEAEDPAQVYIELADKYIAEGDIDAAIDILKKGYEETGSEKLGAALADAMLKKSDGGTEENASQPEPEATPEPVPEATPEAEIPLPQVAAGGKHSIVLWPDGTVKACGANDRGQCDISSWSNIVDVACGDNHSAGLRADGSVVASGSNVEGQCNVGDWYNIVLLDAGDYHTVGLRADGSLLAVGYNNAGQCNVGGLVGGGKTVVDVAAGYEHTVVLYSDGSAAAVGSHTKTQCSVSNWRNIVSIAAGTYHSVGLRSDGTVAATGSNEYGQCDVSSWSDIVYISAGDHFTLGITSDGRLLATGDNSNGQCNTASMSGLALAVGGNAHTVGVTETGELVWTGSNADYQCNLGDNMPSISMGDTYKVDRKYIGTWINADEYGNYTKELQISYINGNQLVFSLMCYEQGGCALYEVEAYAYQSAYTLSAEWDLSHFYDSDYAPGGSHQGSTYHASGSAILSLSGDAVYVTVETFDSSSSRALYQLPTQQEKFVRLVQDEFLGMSREDLNMLIGGNYMQDYSGITTHIIFCPNREFEKALFINNELLLLDDCYWDGSTFVCYAFLDVDNASITFSFDTFNETLEIHYYVYHSGYSETQYYHRVR